MSARRHRHILVAKQPPAQSKAREAGKNGKRAAVQKALPPKPEEMTWPDYLIMLLHIAAELEHALMVEYLFAAYSLGGDGAAEHPRTVREWHDAILTVAREEMGHLLTVQNVLLLVGGPVSFDREDYPWSSPFYPFEFRLEPLSLESLARYVYAEMPEEKGTDAEEKIKRDAKAMLGAGVGVPVGEIYHQIIELLSDPVRIPDSTFDPTSYAYQAEWDEWGRGYRPGTHPPYTKPDELDKPPANERKTRVIVARMGTRQEAIVALREVAGQGEAPRLSRRDRRYEPSHFDRFAAIFKRFQGFLEQNADWSPSWPVAVNPFAGGPEHAPEGSTPILAENSRGWACLFNIRYRMLLTLLTYTYRIPRDAPDTAELRRGPMLGRIFGEMYNLKALAGILVRLPLGDPKRPALRAGPPFQMPYTLVPPSPERNFWRMQSDLLVASEALVEKLLASRRDGRAGATADGIRYLEALRQLDRKAHSWIERVQDGITPSRSTRP